MLEQFQWSTKGHWHYNWSLSLSCLCCGRRSVVPRSYLLHLHLEGDLGSQLHQCVRISGRDFPPSCCVVFWPVHPQSRSRSDSTSSRAVVISPYSPSAIHSVDRPPRSRAGVKGVPLLKRNLYLVMEDDFNGADIDGSIRMCELISVVSSENIDLLLPDASHTSTAPANARLWQQPAWPAMINVVSYSRGRSNRSNGRCTCRIGQLSRPRRYSKPNPLLSRMHPQHVAYRVPLGELLLLNM